MDSFNTYTEGVEAIITTAKEREEHHGILLSETDRLGLLTSALALRDIYPASASEQLALDARIKALNEAGIGTDLQERD